MYYHLPKQAVHKYLFQAFYDRETGHRLPTITALPGSSFLLIKINTNPLNTSQRISEDTIPLRLSKPLRISVIPRYK